MKTCTKCKKTLGESSFYRSGKYMTSSCKPCRNADTAVRVAAYRKRMKGRLVEEFGGRCMDCGLSGPSFLFDFDHRNPEEKSFAISAGSGCVKSYEKLAEESQKCDLVCANCHRFRTHRQRCAGCDEC